MAAAAPQGSLALPQLPQDPGCGKCALINILTINENTASGLRELIIDKDLDLLLLTINRETNYFRFLNRATPRGYSYLPKPHPSGPAGGPAVIHKKDFRITELPELTFPPVESFEFLAFKVLSTTVILIYRRPTHPIISSGKFLVDFTMLLTKASSLSPHLLILGDFNILLNSENQLTSDIKYVLEKFDLTPYVYSRAHLVYCSNLPVRNFYPEPCPQFAHVLLKITIPSLSRVNLSDKMNSLSLEPKSIPPLPTILLSNVQSIKGDSRKKEKMDELRAWVEFDQEIRDTGILALTETWLDEANPDEDYRINGFSGPFRGDRSKEKTKKSKGGGVCFFVNKRYCKEVKVEEEEEKNKCTPDIEYLTISLCPDKELLLFFTVVYIPPDATAANLAKAGRIIDTITARLNSICLDATVKISKFVLGDFNRCNHGTTLKTYEQYVTFVTTQTTTETPVDRCYGSEKGAYKSELRPGLGASDHASVYLSLKPRSGASNEETGGNASSVAGGGRGNASSVAGGGRGNASSVAGGGRGNASSVAGGGRGRGNASSVAGGGRGRGNASSVATGGRGRGNASS